MLHALCACVCVWGGGGGGMCSFVHGVWCLHAHLLASGG